MKITVIGYTEFGDFPDSVRDTEFGYYHGGKPFQSADRIAHLAGRACYQAWDMPNPATRTDEGYLANIIKQGHFSVLEHASVTFYIEDVSRALLAELTRHRHASFSVESQRYVDYSGTDPVIPPAMRGTHLEDDLRDEYSKAIQKYIEYGWALKDMGYSRKEAREAARAVLPNCAPVSIVLSGNMRAFRDIFGKRYSNHADAEIRELAMELLSQLRLIAPASFQDFSEEPFQ